MSLGIIARCDAGGLATITAEVHRHLQPHRTLLLDMADRGRGPCNPDLYEIDDAAGQSIVPMIFDGGVPDRLAEWIGSPGIDVLFTAEYWYDPKILRAAHDAGIRTVELAMPELSPFATTAGDRGTWLRPHEFFAPTDWRITTLPGASLLPVPVARDRLPPTLRRRCEHLYHVTGAAMLDRNGTNLLLAALHYTSEPFLLTVRVSDTWLRQNRIADPEAIAVPSHIEVEWIGDGKGAPNYWEYPADIDLHVMPRRYGGLSLPVQECASLGVPSLMLDPDPYAGLPFVFSVPATRHTVANMKGASASSADPVKVWDADPREIARWIDHLVAGPERIEMASAQADAWARGMAWTGALGEKWAEALSA